jgi:dTDP-4-dehydrorhamnose 3,5-epimerase
LITATALSIPEIVLIEPRVFGDERGFFFESFNHADFAKATGVSATFVQDNHSRSAQNVLRGLHYQVIRPQGKLVRVVIGEVFDVAVDLRRSSPSFGRWVAEILSAENKKQLWIPPGFAHGFLVLSDVAEVVYKTTEYYDPAAERCVTWDDPEIGVAWPLIGRPLLSEKDHRGSSLGKAEVFK